MPAMRFGGFEVSIVMGVPHSWMVTFLFQETSTKTDNKPSPVSPEMAAIGFTTLRTCTEEISWQI